MLLESIALKNIRSYNDAIINFPKGITLLAGDIGAGKSTILLAIEFALFGISRSELTGQALLRHGTQEGRVILKFSANNENYTITRTLKRTSSTISQDAGYLESANGKEMLTPSELRAKIFSILGYPLQFLGKQKNLLYRFTMYTPQEEMKQILYQPTDERIETIRRLFGIDAYRQARDNAHILAKAIKERETAHQSIIDRIKMEKERVQEQIIASTTLISQHALLIKEKTQLELQIKVAELAYDDSEKIRSKLSQERQLIAMQTRNLAIAKQELNQLLEAKRKRLVVINDTIKIIEQLRSTIIIFEKELENSPQTTPQDLQKAQDALESARKDEGKILAIIEQCSVNIKVQPGSECPTCKQKVPHEHIDGLRQTLGAQEVAAKKKHDKITLQIQELRRTLSNLQQIEQKRRQLLEFTTRLTQLQKKLSEDEEQHKIQEEILLQRQSNIVMLESAQKDTTALELQAKQADFIASEKKQLLFQIREQRVQIERRIAALEQQLKVIEEKKQNLTMLQVELSTKQMQLASDQQNRDWLTRKFTPFTSTVERHLLYTIHQHFDSSFRNWFSKLMEDETINARLDHEFSPIITQAGFETDTTNLSGGERTSVSLAWRLALVHTIHSLVPNLGTSGIIILDEPTDGFSSEQLDRVRDVLHEISMEQIIVVSHEQQLEGFVDHILQIRKTAQGSVVEQSI